jgi:hypothetical protein
MSGRSGSISENRILSLAEKELIKWLISHGTPEARDYVLQIEKLQVVRRCSCGCPTVDFYASQGASKILADFYGVTPENVEVGVILHARDGRIAELEIYPLYEQEAAFGLPKIDTLKAS